MAVPVCHSCMQAFDCGVDEAYPYLHLVLHPACPLCHTPISTDPRRNHPSAGSRHGASGESAPAVSLTPRRGQHAGGVAGEVFVASSPLLQKALIVLNEGEDRLVAARVHDDAHRVGERGRR